MIVQTVSSSTSSGAHASGTPTVTSCSYASGSPSSLAHATRCGTSAPVATSSAGAATESSWTSTRGSASAVTAMSSATVSRQLRGRRWLRGGRRRRPPRTRACRCARAQRPAPRPDAVPVLQRPGEGPHPCGEFAVARLTTPVQVDQRDTVGDALRVMVDPGDDGPKPHRETPRRTTASGGGSSESSATTSARRSRTARWFT